VLEGVGGWGVSLPWHEGQGDHEKRESFGSRGKEGWPAHHGGAMGSGGVREWVQAGGG